MALLLDSTQSLVGILLDITDIRPENTEKLLTSYHS